MTIRDRDYFRGWQRGYNGLPRDPYATDEYAEGWRLGYSQFLAKRRKTNARIPL